MRGEALSGLRRVGISLWALHCRQHSRKPMLRAVGEIDGPVSIGTYVRLILPCDLGDMRRPALEQGNSPEPKKGNSPEPKEVNSPDPKARNNEAPAGGAEASCLAHRTHASGAYVWQTATQERSRTSFSIILRICSSFSIIDSPSSRSDFNSPIIMAISTKVNGKAPAIEAACRDLSA